MKLVKNNNKIKLEGSIHFWNLTNKIHVVLDTGFKDKLLKEFMKTVRTKYNANKVTGISRPTISDYINKKDSKIRIDFLFKIINIVNEREFNLNNVERNIKWIGHFNSRGIINPRLPFNLNSREGARFLAAICNEGWISDGMYYSNSKDELRKSVKNDALKIFGGSIQTVKEWIKEKDQYLAFPSVMKDVMCILTDFKGIKSENNPGVPSFILENEELIYGWLEQTIVDEGHVKYYPEKYRREIIWRRSFNKNLDNYRLNKDEVKMLNKIGIKYDLKNIGTYKTKKKIEKIRLQIRISKRRNLLKLRKLVIISDKKKDKTFTEITQGFVRYKEPLEIKDTIIKIYRENGYVDSSKLMKKMKYKTISTASKWIRFYLRLGLLKRVKRISYGSGIVGRIPAKYVLNKNKP